MYGFRIKNPVLEKTNKEESNVICLHVKKFNALQTDKDYFKKGKLMPIKVSNFHNLDIPDIS